MGRRAFLPFLPADNAELSDPSSRAALEAINEDLGQLLQLSPGDFWAAVLSDDRSLHDCLDSFLRFKRCGGKKPSSMGGRGRAARPAPSGRPPFPRAPLPAPNPAAGGLTGTPTAWLARRRARCRKSPAASSWSSCACERPRPQQPQPAGAAATL